MCSIVAVAGEVMNECSIVVVAGEVMNARSILVGQGSNGCSRAGVCSLPTPATQL